MIEKSYQQVEDEEDKALLNQPYLLQVARLDRMKNHRQLIEIFYHLKKNGIKEKLYIVGDGEEYQHLKNYIYELGLDNECLLLGEKENPYIFMRNATLFLHTSLSEGLPTVLIESMICGTPVVAMDCKTGPRDILENGKYGRLIPLGDAQAFFEQTYELLACREKIAHYSALLPEAVTRFHFDNIAKQILDIFYKI